MKNGNRRRWRLVLGGFFSLGALWFLFTHVKISEALQTLSRLDAWMLLAPLTVTVLAFPLRPWRWQLIFSQPGRPEFWPCFRAVYLGNLANNVLPGRAGDLVRCAIVKQEHPSTSLSTALAALGVEKVLDGLTLILVLAGTCLVITPPPWLTQLGLVSGVVFVAGFLALVWVRHRAVWFQARAGRIPTPLPTSMLSGALLRFASGLDAITSSKRLAVLALVTLAIWAGAAALLWTLTLVLRIPLTLPAAATAAAVLGLGLAIPAAPGFVGTYEFFAVAGLRLFEVGAESALALALVMHAWVLVTTTFIGCASLAAGRLTWADVFGITHTEGRLP